MPDAHLFSHEAMKTVFTVRILAESEEVARGMGRECFERIDALENKLSRFVEGSDVHRINTMRAGETLYLSDDCYACLRQAMEVYMQTGGLFDVTLGTRIRHRKDEEEGPVPELEGTLIIHPDAAAITCEVPGREIDLGGIGKGYALDQLRSLLMDWGAEGALVASGASTLLAFGPEAWPIDLAGEGEALRIGLRDRALSASGTGIQGSHIVHPDGVEEQYLAQRMWIVAPKAALADGWSTAAMLMSPEDLAEALEAEESLEAIYVDRGARVEEM